MALVGSAPAPCAPAPLPDWLLEENDAAARQQGVFRAADPLEAAQRKADADADAAEQEAAEAAAQPRRQPPPRGSKLAIPAWLAEELDETAADEGLLIPKPQAGASASAQRGAKAAKALYVAPPAEETRVPPPARVEEEEEEAPEALTRHEAVVAALQGATGPIWEAELPAKAPGDAPYPLWLAPELDALKQLHPGALGPDDAAPPKPPPAPPSDRVFALRPANPGDQIVLISHPGHAEFGAGGARAAQHGAAASLAPAAAAPATAQPAAANGAPKAAPVAARPAASRSAAIKPPPDVWHYSWEIAAAEEDAAGGVKGPPELPSGGNSGPSLAARIAAVVVSHELDARALWRNN